MAEVLQKAEYRSVVGSLTEVSAENLPNLHVALLKELKEKV
jgi:hypothetical protein